MASRPDDFSPADVRLLAEMAGHTCSNPACRALTKASDAGQTGTVNVGKGAHIRAASPAGARYDASQPSQDRSSVEKNGIHLCSTCADIIDKDVDAHPVGLLLDWKRQAQEEANNRLGKTRPSAVNAPAQATPDDVRDPTIGVVAQKILNEKGPLWEVRLFAQILDDELSALADLRSDLLNGLVDGPMLVMDEHEATSWMSDQFKLIQWVPRNIKALFATEFPAAMGPPGVPGDPQALIRVARRIAREYKRVLEWGLRWRCLHVADEFSRLIELGSTAAACMATGFETWLDTIRATLRRVAAGEVPEGSTLTLTLTLAFPDSWADEMRRELDKVAGRTARRRR